MSSNNLENSKQKNNDTVKNESSIELQHKLNLELIKRIENVNLTLKKLKEQVNSNSEEISLLAQRLDSPC